MKIRNAAVSLATVILMSGCAQAPEKMAAPALKDGELALPQDYKSWPRFLLNVQRPDAKQVRDIYINPKGYAMTSGRAFPHGTVMVMENYKAQQQSDGSLVTGADGKLVKGDMAAIFVMGKDQGWGKDVAEGLATGEWIFTAYQPDGKKSGADLNGCRGCHVPLKDKDFVHRFDEYFKTRGGY